MGYWENKVALVTGGSAGLGLAIAKAYVAAGAKVAIIARDPARLLSAVEQVESLVPVPGPQSPVPVVGITADVTRQAEVVGGDRCTEPCGQRQAAVCWITRSLPGLLLLRPDRSARAALRSLRRAQLETSRWSSAFLPF